DISKCGLSRERPIKRAKWPGQRCSHQPLAQDAPRGNSSYERRDDVLVERGSVATICNHFRPSECRECCDDASAGYSRHRLNVGKPPELCGSTEDSKMEKCGSKPPTRQCDGDSHL